MPTHLLPPRLSPLDLTLVAFYLLAITLFGLQFRNKSGDKSLKSYFLANNTIPWWAIALSIVSAETSTLTIISIPGVAFAGDFGFLQVVLGYMLGRIVVAFLFLPRYFRGEMLTAYQLIDQRFGHRLHKLTAGLFLLTRAAAEGVRVFAISIVVGIAIGTGDTLSIAIISALTLLYTFEGGMAAVIWTDVVQMALYVTGTFVALYTLGTHAGGWSHIHAVAAPLGKFHWLDFRLTLTKSYTFWAGVLGGTFLTMASHGTDQLMVQRLLAARNLRESRLALLSSGAVIFLQFTLFLLIGVGLYVFYNQHPQAFVSNDRIFPSFIVQQMPHGVAGLLVAAILAAAMSNLSAALNSLASTTVIDFYVPLRQANIRVPQVSTLRPGSELSQPPRDDTTNISRLATLFWALVLFAIAVYSIHAGQHGHVVEIALSIASVAYGCLLGVFLLGTLTKYATQTGTIIGMLIGFLTNVALWQFPTAHVTLAGHRIAMPQIAFTWYVLIGSLMTFAVGTLFSLILPRPRLRQITATLLLLTLTLPTSAQPIPRSPSLALVPETGRGFSLDNLSPQRTGALAPGIRSPTSVDPTPDFTPISTLLTQAIADKKLPGAVVVIGHNGRIVFEQAYGQRKLAGEPGPNGNPTPAEPMTEDTLFDMASLTKVMVTTVAILQLYEQGKLDLDAPVAKYLPDFTTTTGTPNPQTPGAPSFAPLAKGGVSSEARPLSPPTPLIPGAPSIAPSAMGGSSTSTLTPAALTLATRYKSQITIRQLLTHYSGLPEDISLKDSWGLQTPDKAEGIRRAMAAIPYGPPGITFKYSDINFITLGYLVETLSGISLDEYANQNIFVPLGIPLTQYHAFDKTCGPTLTLGAAIYPGPKPVGRIGMACPRGTWSPYSSVADTAPTAHDNEGTPATNPDFDHLLRGTVHDPTTRRMGGVAGHAGLFSSANDAALFCQALLDKLLHNTGPFPLKQSTLQAALRPQAPAIAAHDATIFTPDGQPTKGVAQRALGWDLNSAFSRPRGELFPITTGPNASGTGHPGSFGHTGFTGTSLWLDPTSNTYVIILANAIHPRGAPPISALRGQIATAAARALGLTTISYVDCRTQLCSIDTTPLLSFRSAAEESALRTTTIPDAHLSRPQSLEPPQQQGHRPDSYQPGAQAPGPLPPIAPRAVSPVYNSQLTATPPTHYDPTHPCAPPVLCDSFGAPTPRPAVVASTVGTTTNLGAPGLAFETWASTPHPPFTPASYSKFQQILDPTPRLKTNAEKLAARRALKSELTGATYYDPQTLTGIDVLEQTHYAALLALAKPHLRIALLTNQSGVDSQGRRTIDLLLHADPAIELTKIFTPEHGLQGKQDTEHLTAEEDPTTHLPVISLYGAKPADRHPRQSDLRNIDAVVIDLQDAGVRFWTYTSVLGYFLEASARSHIQIVVLDRPNPVGGLAFGGPMSDPGTEFYANYMPTPVRHGMTFGELARFYNANAKQVDLDPQLLDARTVSMGTPTQDDKPPATRPGLGANLTVIPMQNWHRSQYYEQTGVPWLPPSPNLRTPRAAILYPAIGLIETTNISVGRGAPTPFEQIGAPWINPKQLADYLTARQIPGIQVTPITLTIAETPEHYPSHGQTIPAIHFEVTDPQHFDSPEFGIELLAALHHLYPTQFQLDKVKTLLCNAQVLAGLQAGKDPHDIAQSWLPTLQLFTTQRTQALLY